MRGLLQLLFLSILVAITGCDDAGDAPDGPGVVAIDAAADAVDLDAAVDPPPTDAAPGDGALDPADQGPEADAVPAVAECGDGVRTPGELCLADPYFWPTPEGSPVKAVLADLDADGRPEVITAVLWTDAVFVQHGTGHQDHPISQRVLLDVEGVADVVAGDVDGDGDLDVVAAGLTGRAVQVLLNEGGRLTAGATLDVAGQAFTIDGGDFDEDGYFDVLVANFSRGGATVAFGSAAGGLERLLQVRTGVEPHGAVAADVDADGHLDIVVANAGTHDPGPDKVTVNFGGGDGTFSAPLELTVGNGPFHVAVGDLNHDGHPDIVAGNFGTPIRGAEYDGGDTISVLLGTGDRQFAAAQHYPAGDGPNHVVLADVNGDGHLDALTADRGNFDFGERRAVGGGTVTVLLGAGDGRFTGRVDLDLGRSATGVTVGDLDGDLAPEIIGVAHDGRRLAAFFQRP